MSPYFAILCALAIAAQASCEEWDYSSLGDLKSEHAKLGEDLRSLVNSFAESARDQVEYQVNHAQSTIELSKEKALQKINNQYDAVSRHIRSIEAPQICLDEAQNLLEDSKTLNNGSFFKCSNLTTAALDIVSIGSETLGLITNILLSLDDILNGWSDCWSWNPIKFIYCSYSYIKTALKDLYHTFSDLKDFTTTVTNLVKDIKDQINYCSNNGVNQAHQDTIKSLEHIQQCSQLVKNQKHLA